MPFAVSFLTMAEIFPFRGFHYNPKLIASLSEVITPPYDNIPAGEESKYWKRSPYNFAHVDLPLQENDDYSAALQSLTQWIEHKVLVGDTAPGFYWYRQSFAYEAARYSRDALVCAVQLRDFSEGVIRPHENTHGKAKKDRLQSIRKTGFNLSHIFGMVKDPRGVMQSLIEGEDFSTPWLQGTTDDGAEHFIWKLSATKSAALTAFFKDQPIYIVDGHHRYESALAYAKEVGAYRNEQHPASQTLFTICNTFEPGLVVCPTHRGIYSLGEHKSKLNALSQDFTLEKVNPDCLKLFTSKTTNTPEFLVGYEGSLLRCTPKSSGPGLLGLPMHWSDRKILDELLQIPESDFSHRIHYEKDALKLWENRNRFEFMIFHARPKISDVTEIADAKGFMPPKSTYFYPKLASGLILRQLS